ncbi:MAG: cbb3-type cytochrome c oxidase subunit 3 [Bacteroidota bacterium]
MYKDVLRSIDGVSLFPVVAIIIFTLFFVLLLIYVFRMSREKVDHFAAIPLQEDADLTPDFSPEKNLS